MKNKLFWMIAMLFVVVFFISVAGLFVTALAAITGWLYSNQLEKLLLVIFAISVIVSFGISYLFSKWGGFEWKR